MEEKRFNPYPALFVGIVVLLLAYSASYWMMARLGASPRLDYAKRETGYEPYYSVDPRINSILGRFFMPAHEIDRNLRPGFWHIVPLTEHYGTVLD